MLNIFYGRWSFKGILKAIALLAVIAVILLLCYAIPFVALTPMPFVQAVTLVFTTKAVYESALVGLILFTLLISYF